MNGTYFPIEPLGFCVPNFGAIADFWFLSAGHKKFCSCSTHLGGMHSYCEVALTSRCCASLHSVNAQFLEPALAMQRQIREQEEGVDITDGIPSRFCQTFPQSVVVLVQEVEGSWALEPGETVSMPKEPPVNDRDEVRVEGREKRGYVGKREPRR